MTECSQPCAILLTKPTMLNHQKKTGKSQMKVISNLWQKWRVQCYWQRILHKAYMRGWTSTVHEQSTLCASSVPAGPTKNAGPAVASATCYCSIQNTTPADQPTPNHSQQFAPYLVIIHQKTNLYLSVIEICLHFNIADHFHASCRRLLWAFLMTIYRQMFSMLQVYMSTPGHSKIPLEWCK